MPSLQAAVLLAAALAVVACTGEQDEPLLVGAASDLRPAFTLLGERFEQETSQQVVFSFGSSGLLAQQIIEGAPYDLFASADESYVEMVLEAGRAHAASRSTYAYGRVVIWSRTDSWRGWQQLGDLEGATIAMANPEHAPYGRAARQALQAAGVWDRLSSSVVYGENVVDTQRLAASGNVDVAIVALSLALASDEQDEGTWVLIDEALHGPLRQQLVVVARDPDRARQASAFASFVASEEGRAVMRRYGFVPPE